MERPRRERQRWKRSTRGSRAWKAGSMPGTGEAGGGDCWAGAGGEGGRAAKGEGSTHLQQQLHHAQAVVFHCVDEWGAAAFNVLQKGGKVSESLQALPNQPAASIPAAGSGVSIPVDTSSPTPTPRSRGVPRKPHPLGGPAPAPLGPASGPRLLTTASMSAPRSSKSSTASGHSMFTATCKAVSPEVREDSV